MATRAAVMRAEDARPVAPAQMRLKRRGSAIGVSLGVFQRDERYVYRRFPYENLGASSIPAASTTFRSAPTRVVYLFRGSSAGSTKVNVHGPMP